MNERNDLVIARRVSLLLLTFYGVSFYLPVVLWLPDPLSGCETFLLGMHAIAHPGSPGPGEGQFNEPAFPAEQSWARAAAWLANPLFWVGIVLLATGRGGESGIMGMAAVLLGAAWFVIAPSLLLRGFYVWWASMGLLEVVGLTHPLWSRSRVIIGHQPRADAP